MSIAIWIVAGVLAAIFVLAGGMKLTTPRAQLQEKGQCWASDFSDTNCQGAVEGGGDDVVGVSGPGRALT
jgi:hypothetical protein